MNQLIISKYLKRLWYYSQKALYTMMWRIRHLEMCESAKGFIPGEWGTCIEKTCKRLIRVFVRFFFFRKDDNNIQ